MKYLYTASIIIAIMVSLISFIPNQEGLGFLILAMIISPVCVFIDYYNYRLNTEKCRNAKEQTK